MLEKLKTHEIQNSQMIYGGEIKTKVNTEVELE